MSATNVLDKLLDGVEVEWKTIDEVFNIAAGGDKPKAVSEVETEEFGVPILSNGIDKKSLYGWTDKAKINQPSLTVSARGTIGWTSYRDRPFFPIVRLLVLTPKSEINLKYAYYFMKTIENAYNVPSAGIPQLTKPMIKDTQFPIPCANDLEKSLDIQTEIVRILDTFTELKTELTTELRFRKKQFNYYCDQFLMVEKDEMEWKTLGDVAEINTGQKPPEVLDGATAFDYINAGTTRSGYAENPNCDGDTVITPSRGQGGIGFVGYQKEPFWLGPLCYKLRSIDESALINKYLFYFLQSNNELLLGLKKEGGVPAVNKSDLTGVAIPIPKINRQKRVVDILDTFDTITYSTSAGLPREIELRTKQYEYYRDLLLDFPKPKLQS